MTNERENEVRELVAEALEKDNFPASADHMRRRLRGGNSAATATDALLPLIDTSDRAREALEACVSMAEHVHFKGPDYNASRIFAEMIGRAELAARKAAKPKTRFVVQVGIKGMHGAIEASSGLWSAIFYGPNARERAEAECARLNADAPK